MHGSQLLIALVAALVVAPGCSDPDGPSTTGDSTSPLVVSSEVTATSDVDSSTSISVPPTTPPIPTVPAGLQYLDQPEVLPPGLTLAPQAVATSGDTVVVVGNDAGTFAPVAAVLTGSTWTRVAIDDFAGLVSPYGRPITSVRVNGVTSGPAGFVIAGDALTGNSDHPEYQSPVGFLWHSIDGVSWTRTDLRSVLGARAALVPAVTDTDDGYLALVATGDVDVRNGPGQIAVLWSPDGVTWSIRSELSEPWTLSPSALLRVGSSYLLTAFEFVCTDDHTFMKYGDYASGSQIRLYRSADAGVTWNQVDTDALGVVAAVETPPTDPSGCPTGDDSVVGDELDARYENELGDVVAGDDAVLVFAPDNVRAAVSSDLITWSPTEFPGVLPIPDSGVDSPDRSFQVVRGLLGGGTELTLLSLEPRRNSDDMPAWIGHQVIGWSSSDRGLSWVRLPFTEGVFVGGDASGVDADIRRLADGSVLLVTAVRGSGQTPLERTALARISRAGAVFDPEQCVLSPGVVCPFADLAGRSLAGMDLSGADLEGAELIGADLTGTDFTGARLDGASLDESVAGALLDGASLRYANISIDPSAPIAHFDFGGLDLTGAYISSDEYETPAPLQADFTGAHLDRAVFSDIDLTGSDLTAATMQGIYWASRVVCPNGQPPADDQC